MQTMPKYTGQLTENDVNRIIKNYLGAELYFTVARKKLQLLLQQPLAVKEEYVRIRRYSALEQVSDQAWCYGRHSFRLFIKSSKAGRYAQIANVAGILVVLAVAYLLYANSEINAKGRLEHTMESIAEEGNSPSAINWAIYNRPDNAVHFKSMMDALAKSGNPAAMFYSGMRAPSVAETQRLVTASAAAGYSRAIEAVQSPAFKNWLAKRESVAEPETHWYKF